MALRVGDEVRKVGGGLLACMIVAACGGGSSAAQGDAAPNREVDAGGLTDARIGGIGIDAGVVPSPSEIAEARALIEAASLSNVPTLDGLRRIRFTAAGLAASADLLRAGAQGDTVWAAMVVYGGRGTDPAPLRPYLTSSDTTIRSFAAEGLAAMGDVAGLEALVEGLLDDQVLAGSEPPAAGWEAALVSLERYTGKQDLSPTSSDPTMSDRMASRDRWAAWLSQNKGRLLFDPAARIWRVQ